MKEMLIDSNSVETRLAVVEDGRLVEFYDERKKERGITGNIYKGRVVRVLPGMQAAFIEVGLDRTAFLHVKDVQESLGDFFGKDDDRDEAPKERIQDLIKEGQDIVVQVDKEPIGTKGARLTSYVSLPGRYLVLMPTYQRVGISRRIYDDKERRRLKELVRELRPPGYGFIIRTVCEGMTRDEIAADMNYLVRLWKNIQSRAEASRSPVLLYEELDLTLRAIRDMLTSDVKRFVIESLDEYERAGKFADEFMPEVRWRLENYEGKDSLFDSTGIEVDLEKALDRRVWLPSGGFLVIDQMEALTAIDVNTGKFVGKKSSDDTILKTNLEAAAEVVHQLKLRNIGGIIVIDFIDMSRVPDREKVYRALKDALKADKARTNILKISELGIVEMTRKRTRESITQSLLDKCPTCDGNGLVKSVETMALEIYRNLARELPAISGKAIVYCSPEVARRLASEDELMDALSGRFGKKITVKAVDTFKQEDYEIV